MLKGLVSSVHVTVKQYKIVFKLKDLSVLLLSSKSCE